MVTAILFTAFRLGSNIFLRGRFRRHDWAIIAATAFAIGQSIATSIMVSNGLGQHQSKLSPSTIASYEKASLAASVLYIAALTSSKLSLFVFLNEMLAASQTKFHKFMYAVWIILICYTVRTSNSSTTRAWLTTRIQLSATFSLSFACGLPKPYDTLDGHCINFVNHPLLHSYEMPSLMTSTARFLGFSRCLRHYR